jgi:hypothetical protein
MNAPESEYMTKSNSLGILGLMTEGVGLAARNEALNAKSWGGKAQALKAVKGAAIVGKSFGLVGAVFTAWEGATDGNGFTVGDGVKVGIGLVTAFTPIGWAYGLVDLGFYAFTDTSLTDRIGNGIDNALK